MTAISQAIELSGLTLEKSEVLTAKFGSMVDQIADWKQKAEELIITDEAQTEEIALAKDGYKFIKSVRLDIEKTRKVLKEDSLKEGRAIDLIAKSLTLEVSPLELELEKKAKFIEIQEEIRKTARTQERYARASSFGFAIHQSGMIIEMSDEMFETFLSGLKADAEKREADEQAAEKLRIEAEQKAEAERLEAERVEKERIEAQRIENKRLKIEAEKREAEIAEERKQAEAERIKQEAKIKAERDKAEAERKATEAENARIQAKKDEEIRLEREKSEKLQAEIRAKAEQEEAERLAKEAKEKEALDALDKEKLELYISGLLNIKVPCFDDKELESEVWTMINSLEKALFKLAFVL